MTTDPAQAWCRIEAWLSTRAPSLDPGLRPPADEAAIAAAESTLGRSFPDDFRASLRVHDGQEDEPAVGLWPWGLRLGSLAALTRCWLDDLAGFDAEESAERLDWLDEGGRVRQVHLHPARIPIAGSRFWDYDQLLLDFVPGPKGTTGQVVARSDVSFVFVCASFGELLERTADGLEDGTLTLEPGPYGHGLVCRSRAGGIVPPARYFHRARGVRSGRTRAGPG